MALTKPSAPVEEKLRAHNHILRNRCGENLNRQEDRKGNKDVVSRAARMLMGEPTYEDEEEIGDEHSIQTQTIENPSPSPSRIYGNDGLTTASASSAAATLIEGALPVREFPDCLTSEPASKINSAASSLNGDREIPSWSRSTSGEFIEETEELRCVIAIIRQ